MLFWLAHLLSNHWHFFNVFQYLTFRSILSTVTAFSITLLIGPSLISALNFYRIGQVIRDEGPKTHLSKHGTPTMGGLMILIAMLFSTLLWGNLTNHYLWIVIGVMMSFGFIGFLDDYFKLVKKSTRGMSARSRYFWESMIGLAVAIYLYWSAQTPAETSLLIPFFKHVSINLGIFFIPFAYFVIVGAGNAVNLTDGLDGLAILPVVMIGSALAIFAYLVGNAIFSKYLILPHIAGTGELVIICGALAGAGLGFLWFNAYPAQVFMGDTGSLSLGAMLGTIAVIVRQELVLALMSGIFVLETISVIIQVLYFRQTHKRIFLMAPLHHHFELKGWPEPKIIVRFWIISFVLVLLGLATLKLR